MQCDFLMLKDKFSHANSPLFSRIQCRMVTSNFFLFFINHSTCKESIEYKELQFFRCYKLMQKINYFHVTCKFFLFFFNHIVHPILFNLYYFTCNDNSNFFLFPQFFFPKLLKVSLNNPNPVRETKSSRICTYVGWMVDLTWKKKLVGTYC